MSHMTVSTIIPAYRAAQTVGRALDSLLAQTRPPDEIVVVDDGSPDDLAAALQPYGDKVTLVRKANGGAASARNLGIERSHGELIAFLDADDYWEPAKLERQLELLERHPEVGLTSSRSFLREIDGALIGPCADALPYCDRVLTASGEEAFEIATRIWTSTVLVRRAVLGTHRFDERLRTAEDVEVWFRIAVANSVYILAEPLATGVALPGSLSRANTDDDCTNLLSVVRRHAALLGPAGLRRREAKVYQSWAALHLAHRLPRPAFRPACHRVRLQPWSAQAWWIVFKSGTWATGSWLVGRVRHAQRHKAPQTQPVADQP